MREGSDPLVRQHPLTRRLAALAAVLVGVPVLTLGPSVGTTCASGVHQQVKLYRGISLPLGIDPGPWGLWFTNPGINSIGRIVAHRFHA
jgi:hypothetical protein